MTQVIKFHKQFGQVEFINSNENVTEIKVCSTNEIKKLATKFLNETILKDVPFEVPVKAKRAKVAKTSDRELTAEEQHRIAYLNATGQGIEQLLRQSYINWKTGRAGAAKMY